MASHKKGKRPPQHAASTRTGAPAAPARKSTSSGQASVATASRPAVAVAAPTRSESANASAKASTAGVVRAAPPRDRTYRSRMTRYKRRQQRQAQIVGAALVVIAVAALAYVLWPRPAALSQASVSATATARACTTNAQTGLSGTPAVAGGPAAVSGKLVTLPGCLEYVDTKVGTGAAVKNGDTVTVEYTGWLANGTKFDASADHPGQPFSFQVGAGSVIPGWDQGLVGMKVGGQRRLIIPPAMGYGASGAGSTIPPNATLIFDVKIDKIG
jgi:peptidylprolyl isomerase